MQKMGWFGVAIGALIVTSSVTIRLPIQLYRNYAAILYLFRDIASYLSKVADFDPPHLYLAPPQGVIPVEFRRDLWHLKTRVPGLSCDVVCVILHLAVLVEL